MKHKQKVDVYWMKDLGPVVRAEDYQAVCDEAEALVRDAERYRHLRDGVLIDGEINEDMYVHIDHPSYPNQWALIGNELDEAIDTAMQEKQS